MWVWQQFNESYNGMGVGSGAKELLTRERASTSPSVLLTCHNPERFRSKEQQMEGKVILLVEDNPDDEALTMRALHKNSLANKVIVARDGVKALDILLPGSEASGEEHSIPELVLLDLQLPKISGLEVLQRIRADDRTKRLPVVILTSSTEERDLFEGYNLGANSYIQKPVDFSEFLEAVRQLGMYWLVLNRPPPKSVDVVRGR